MNILIPESNMKLLRAYHTSSKLLVPLICLSYVSNKYEFPFQTPLHIATSFNIGYHSYVSTSCIISDYIKHPPIEKVARLSNFNLHTLATFGLIYASSKLCASSNALENNINCYKLK